MRGRSVALPPESSSRMSLSSSGLMVFSGVTCSCAMRGLAGLRPRPDALGEGEKPAAMKPLGMGDAHPPARA